MVPLQSCTWQCPASSEWSATGSSNRTFLHTPLFAERALFSIYPSSTRPEIQNRPFVFWTPNTHLFSYWAYMCYLQSSPGTSAIVVLLALIPAPQYPVCAEILHQASFPSVCSLILKHTGRAWQCGGWSRVRQTRSKRKTEMNRVREQQLCPFSWQTQPFLRG